MALRDDCRHYLARTTATGEVVQNCRLGAATTNPFSCPDDCLFFEKRTVSGPGWAQAPAEPMSNTADGLIGLPKAKRPRRGKGKR